MKLDKVYIHLWYEVFSPMPVHILRTLTSGFVILRRIIITHTHCTDIYIYIFFKSVCVDQNENTYIKRQYHPVELLWNSLLFFLIFSAFSFTQLSRSNDGLSVSMPSLSRPSSVFSPTPDSRQFDHVTANVYIYARTTSPPPTACACRDPFPSRGRSSPSRIYGQAGSGCSPWQHRSRTPSRLPPCPRNLNFRPLQPDPSPLQPRASLPTALCPRSRDGVRVWGRCFFIV